MKGFFIGLGIGVALGMLYAPSAGEELRNDLVNRANSLADNARSTFEEGREKVRSGVNAFRGGSEQSTGTEGRY